MSPNFINEVPAILFLLWIFLKKNKIYFFDYISFIQEFNMLYLWWGICCFYWELQILSHLFHQYFLVFFFNFLLNFWVIFKKDFIINIKPSDFFFFGNFNDVHFMIACTHCIYSFSIIGNHHIWNSIWFNLAFL